MYRILNNIDIYSKSDASKLPCFLTDILPSTLKEKEEEYKQQQEDILSLTTKHEKVCEDLQKQEQTSRDTEKMVAHLQSEIINYEQTLKSYEKNDTRLRLVIQNQELELKEQEEKFHQAGNPDYDHVIIMENCMKAKLENFGKTLKDTLLKEVNENNKRIEEKLNQVMQESKTYSETVKNTIGSGTAPTNIPETSVDFRTIMKEAREEEITEEKEQKRRTCNIILHGVMENKDINKEESKKSDEDFIATLLESVKVPATYKSFGRVGYDQNKARPIKLVMSCEEDKQKIMSSLGNLKDQEHFHGVSITDDYTLQQRKTIKEWVNKAKQKNNEEAEDSQYIWKARGTPKNGIFLKKLLKRKPIDPQQ